MQEPALIERLATAVEKATQSAKLLVTGNLPDVDPGLEVKGLGRVSVPLKRGVAKALLASSRIAASSSASSSNRQTSSTSMISRCRA